jgi:hypothetical protein
MVLADFDHFLGRTFPERKNSHSLYRTPSRKMADKVDRGIKRKRPAQESSKPSKKVAIEGDRNFKISLQDPKKWAPIISIDTLDAWAQSQVHGIDLHPRR